VGFGLLKGKKRVFLTFSQFSNTFLGSSRKFSGGFSLFPGNVGSARSQLFMPGLHHAHTLQQKDSYDSVMCIRHRNHSILFLLVLI